MSCSSPSQVRTRRKYQHTFVETLICLGLVEYKGRRAPDCTFHAMNIITIQGTSARDDNHRLHNQNVNLVDFLTIC